MAASHRRPAAYPTVASQDLTLPAVVLFEKEEELTERGDMTIFVLTE
jgi:hypothetical protein